MTITRKSMISGITRSLDLAVTEEQLQSYLNGELLQNAFPNLSASDREFIKSGITDEEWKALFGDDTGEE